MLARSAAPVASCDTPCRAESAYRRLLRYRGHGAEQALLLNMCAWASKACEPIDVRALVQRLCTEMCAEEALDCRSSYEL
jgi:hypothetical protein